MRVPGPAPAPSVGAVRTDDLLIETYGRVRELVPEVVDGLGEDDLARRPRAGANSIAWLVWHLSRVQDASVEAALGDGSPVWTAQGWQQRLGLDLPAEDTGYGHSPEEVGRVRSSAELLAGYHAAVAARTEHLLRGVGDDELDRVVDEGYDPPVTLGVRLVSVASDCLQHLGQAAYARGLLTG